MQPSTFEMRSARSARRSGSSARACRAEALGSAAVMRAASAARGHRAARSWMRHAQLQRAQQSSPRYRACAQTSAQKSDTVHIISVRLECQVCATSTTPRTASSRSEVAWDDGEAPLASLHVHEERAKTIVSENKSPDLSFRFSVNPYRGCQHACAYCYARPSHQYWGFGAGTDFEREIIVKVNAPELLREAFERTSWQRRADHVLGQHRLLSTARRSLSPDARAAVDLRRVQEPGRDHHQERADAARHRRAARARGAHARAWCSSAFRSPTTRSGARSSRARRRSTAASRRSPRCRRRGSRPASPIAPIIPGLNDRDIPALLARAKASRRDARVPHAAAPAGRGEAGVPGAPARSAARQRRQGRTRGARRARRAACTTAASASACAARARAGTRSTNCSRCRSSASALTSSA